MTRALKSSKKHCYFCAENVSVSLFYASTATDATDATDGI